MNAIRGDLRRFHFRAGEVASSEQDGLTLKFLQNSNFETGLSSLTADLISSAVFHLWQKAMALGIVHRGVSHEQIMAVLRLRAHDDAIGQRDLIRPVGARAHELGVPCVAEESPFVGAHLLLCDEDAYLGEEFR